MSSNKRLEMPRMSSQDQERLERRIANGVKMYSAFLRKGKEGIHERLEELKLERLNEHSTAPGLERIRTLRQACEPYLQKQRMPSRRN